MRLVQFTDSDGERVYINPSQVKDLWHNGEHTVIRMGPGDTNRWYVTDDLHPAAEKLTLAMTGR